MKLFQFLKDGAPALGVWTPQGLYDVGAMAQSCAIAAPATMLEAARQGTGAIEQILAQAKPVVLKEETLCFAPALTGGEKILCIGVNYAAHAAETGHALPPAPVVFSKFENAHNAHLGTVKLSRHAYQYDYEAELVVILGKTCRDVTVQQARDAIFGYTCGNDLSARDIQKRTSQWLLGKTMDGCGPTGPYVVTAQSIDAGHLRIASYVNGEQRQHSNTENMIFKPDYLISEISKYVTLRPGDMIFTGTPDGVIGGYAPQDQVWLKAGDTVDVTIEQIGTLRVTLA